jgi:hypothetical protein
MERFFRSREEQDAVIRRLEIIREAVKQIPAEVKEGHPEVPLEEDGWHEGRLDARILRRRLGADVEDGHGGR